jgi:predicted phage tail protein
MKGAHGIRNVAEPRPLGRRRRRRPWRLLTGTCLALAVAAGPAVAVGGSIARAASPGPPPTPTGPCATPSRSAAVFVNPVRTVLCLQATPGNAQVALTWDRTIPDSLSGDFFAWYQATGAPSASQTPTVTGKSAVVSGLTNGTMYTFWIASSDPAQVVSSVVQATPVTTPDPPTGLIATRGNGQVTLTWAAPASDGGTPITGYRVSISPEAGPETSTDVPAVTNRTVTGLTNGTAYDFTVTAINAVGTSPPSNVARAIPATAPDTVTGLTAIPGNAQATLTWVAPASNGGAPVIGYDLYVGTGTGTGGSQPLARITGTAVTVAGLANGTRYYFTVVAVNRIGPSGPQQASAVPVTVPGTPTGLTAKAANGQATLSWTAPASDGGTRITGYLVYEGTSPGGESGPLVGGQPVTATHATVPGLTSGTTYYFTVVAVNAVGLSQPSGEASATGPPGPSTATSPRTAPPTPPPPTVVPPTTLTAQAGDGQATLSWTASVPEAGSSPVTGYEIYQATAPGAPMVPVDGTTGISFTVPGLKNGTTYYFTVAALSASGQQSAQSIEASARPQHLQHQVAVPAEIPEKLIVLMAAAAAAIVGIGITMITRWWSNHRPKPPVPVNVRAELDTVRSGRVSVRDTGREPVHTIRFEPDRGVATTTITKERP